MNEFFKSIIGKCFLYTLLFVGVFTALILLGCFVAGNTDVFEWQGVGRAIIVTIGLPIVLAVIAVNEEIM